MEWAAKTLSLGQHYKWACLHSLSVPVTPLQNFKCSHLSYHLYLCSVKVGNLVIV